MTKKSGPKSALPGSGGDSRARPSDAPRVSLAGGAGYRFDGDRVALNAELSLAGLTPKGRYLFELVASESGVSGSAKPAERIVATAPLDLPAPLGPITHRASVVASAKIPPTGPSYSMTLRLIHEEKTGTHKVLDQTQFALLETFPAPRFVGSASYELEGGDVIFEIDRIESTRGFDNLSGTLSLELRAAVSHLELEREGGMALATFTLAPLNGGYFIGPLLCRTKMQRGMEKGQSLYLVLREFTGDGYATRDYREVSLREGLSASKSERKATKAESPAKTNAKSPSPLAANDVRHAAPESSVSNAAPALAKVSVGHASIQELTQLEGITLKIAKEIVKARPFASLGDLLKVRGLGQKTLDRLKGRLAL